jgi:acyl-CoA synthetase (AMP-forming)/AMP-acid ligase II
LPPDTPGQIVARKAGMMVGDWRDPAATAAALVDGWLHTGAIGTIDDRGLLWMLDRMKDILESGGLNICSAELERVILEVAGVTEVAIIAVPDDRFGERRSRSCTAPHATPTRYWHNVARNYRHTSRATSQYRPSRCRSLQRARLSSRRSAACGPIDRFLNPLDRTTLTVNSSVD